jgi:hypothetical protein
VGADGSIELAACTRPLLRCFTLALGGAAAQNQFVVDPRTLQQVVDVAEEFGEEELISNALKIIRQLV